MNTYHLTYKDTDHAPRAPRAVFLDTLLQHKRNAPIVMAKLGISPASLNKWSRFFKNGRIFAFHQDPKLAAKVKKALIPRVSFAAVNIRNTSSIFNAFCATRTQFDLIVDDDVSHEADDHGRLLRNAHHFLQPGGVFVIDRVRDGEEAGYRQFLDAVLHDYDKSFFVELAGEGKALVLIKNGLPIFTEPRKRLTIITSSRFFSNLEAVKESILFQHVRKWIIVHEEKRRFYEAHPKIQEVSSAEQAMQLVDATPHLVYFCDDDNIIQPELFDVLLFVSDDTTLTFNQVRRATIERGDNGNTRITPSGTEEGPSLYVDDALCYYNERAQVDRGCLVF